MKIQSEPFFMEKEKIYTGDTNFIDKIPKMMVIKGRCQEFTSAASIPWKSEIRKFVKLKETTAFHIELPLDSIFKRIIKRSIDIFLSTIIITCLLSWLIPLFALLIKLDSKGPVFFLQKRNKKDGKLFTCIKFRSMIENDEVDILPPTINDERITRVGRFLRNHSLDNLPQFFNVWLGDMSIIGPYPQMVSVNNKYEELIKFYDYRHKVKPGITGLSQVIGYGEESGNLQIMREHVQLDIFYVRHWSFSLDIKILWYSFRKLFTFSSPSLFTKNKY